MRARKDCGKIAHRENGRLALVVERLKLTILVAAVIVLAASMLNWLAAMMLSGLLVILLIVYLALSAPKPKEAELREREYVAKRMENSLEAGGIRWRVVCQLPPYDRRGRVCWVKEPLCPECGQPMLEEGFVHPYFKCYGCKSESDKKYNHPDSRRTQAYRALAAKVDELRREYYTSSDSSA